MSNVHHSSKTDLWYTPRSIITRVRNVLGAIELDPASDPIANRRVEAKCILTRDTDGLETPWPPARTVFCNPPGGKTRNRSNVALFWQRMMEYREVCPTFDHGIFLAFSIEALQTTQGKGVLSMLAFPLCVPARRIAFDTQCDWESKAPSHANVIVYVPGRVNVPERFQHAFESLGQVANVPVRRGEPLVLEAPRAPRESAIELPS